MVGVSGISRELLFVIQLIPRNCMARDSLGFHCMFTSLVITYCSSHQDNYLVLSIDSKYGPACDRFRIIASDDGLQCLRLQPFKRFYTSEGQKTLSVAVSQPLEAVVLMNLEGTFVDSFGYSEIGELLLKKSGVEQITRVTRPSTRRAVIGHSGEVSAISFSNEGTRLVLVDNQVQTSR